MKDYIVPLRVQGLLQDRLNAVCKEQLLRKKFYADARGKYIYLCELFPDWTFQRLGRLTYLGDLENMEFAMLKPSSERFDPKERSFPGAELLDGTIEGAMKALIKAYRLKS